MASYKVSYKVLRQQGDELKSVAKTIDGYSDRINRIISRLGDDKLLEEIRKNLNNLRGQLGESRAVINTAGDFLKKSIEGYTGTETRQVKKVDSMKSHNRDFYKKPIVVASAGGGAVGASGTGASGSGAPGMGASAGSSQSFGAAASTGTGQGFSQGADQGGTTINYTDNSVNVLYESNMEAGPGISSMGNMDGSIKSTLADIPITGAQAGNGDFKAAGMGALGGIAASAASFAGASYLKKKKEDGSAEKNDPIEESDFIEENEIMERNEITEKNTITEERDL